MKKLVILILTLCFAIAMFSGCSGDPAGSTDMSADATGDSTTEPTSTATAQPPTDLNLDETTLKWVVIGDKGVDHDLIWNLINEKTLAMDNVKAKVEFIFCTWADYDQTYPLMMSSGEEVDMFYVSEWVKYSAHARKGAFQEITMDMLEQYAPNTYASVPQTAWDQVKVDGKIYMVPATQDEFADGNLCFMLRGDYMEEFGMTSVSTQPEIEEYLTKVKQNHPEVIPWNGGVDYVGCFLDATNSYKSWSSLLPMSYMNLKDETQNASVYSYMNDCKDKFLQALDESHDWVGKGFWSSSILNKSTLTHDEFLAGTTAMCTQNVLTLSNYYNMIMQDHPEYKPYIGTLVPEDGVVYRTGFNNNGTAISATCQQPERVLMWLDAVLHDQELNDLVLLGIQDKHWILNDDGTTSTGPDASNLSSFSCWGINSYECKRSTVSSKDAAGIIDYFSGIASKNLGVYMTFDTTDYANELAAMTAIQAEMEDSLFGGLYDDPEAAAEQYMERLKTAGWDKMYDAYKTQLQTYISSIS